MGPVNWMHEEGGGPKMVELAVQAGLNLESEKADLLPYQTFLVFRKAS